MKFPTYEEMGQEVANRVLDEYEYKGKTLRQWIEIISAAALGTNCISREQAIDALDKCHCGGKDENGSPWIYKENAVEAIEQLPPIQPKRGRWISADAIFGGVPFYCSECGENTRDTVMGEPRWNFCPNCGADMRGEQDE